MSLHPATRVGAVHLTVRDAAAVVEFYVQRLGVRLIDRTADGIRLGTHLNPLLVLHEDPGARRVPGTAGLYHFAILVPSRAALALALRRLVNGRTPLQGFADHGVSEAIYLADVEGNGIEIYRDRPRAEWPASNGRLEMVTDPLDVEALLAAAPDVQEPPPLPADTTMGHVHLHVGHLDEAETFYCGVVGFDLMQRFGSSALFMSAGGYHHHVAVNTWAGVGAPPQPAGTAGLRYFTIEVPDEQEASAMAERLRVAGIRFDAGPSGEVTVQDPSGNTMRIRPAPQ